MSDQAVLDVQHLSMHFGGLAAIDDVSFSASRGKITAVIGPNGAGKTTLFNCLTGFYRPTQGCLELLRNNEIFYLEQMNGVEISQKAKIARTFQNIRLFSKMTALENLIVAQHNHLVKQSGYNIYGILGLKRYKNAEKQAIDKAKYWLETVGIDLKLANTEAGSFPYGEQRKLEIARAMCTDPILLCLDEPAAGLNPKESKNLNELLLHIVDQNHISALLIEHDMDVVMNISDHIVVLDYGQKISDGTPDFIKNDPAVIKAYLGEEAVE